MLLANHNIIALRSIVSVEQLPGPACYAGISVPLCSLNARSTETISILRACGFYKLSAEADLLPQNIRVQRKLIFG